jgi:uncharacterized membrane protein
VTTSNSPTGEKRWPVSLVLTATALLQTSLPEQYTLGGRFLGPAIEIALVVVLTLLNPSYILKHTSQLRNLALLLASVISLFNIFTIAKMISDLATGNWTRGAASLLLTGASVWLINVIATSLWYWEHDLGGPASRAQALQQHPSFLFPQMANPEFAEPHWRPTFVDYFYLSFTNASAFSPTDVLPLKPWAKILMMVQSVVSLTTLAIVIARAINTLH